METAEVGLMKAPMKTWHEKDVGIVLAKDVSGLWDGEDGNKAESGEEDVGFGVSELGT